VKDARIINHPLLKFDRGQAIKFYYNDRPMKAYEGETVAAALYANGVRIFSRSFKYHRPRGISCMSGHCSNCLMRVNGIPNIRTCHEPVKQGMKVESQNAWPSLELDVASFAGYLDFLVRPGFQYKRFIRPRWAYHIWERFFRNRAGIGEICDQNVHLTSKLMKAEPEIVIVGAGIAGLAAALHAASTGAEVWLIEKSEVLGGRMCYQTEEIELPEAKKKARGFIIASEMTEEIKNIDNCRIMKKSTAFAWDDTEGILAITRPGELWELRPRCVVVSTGSYEYPLVFENNDLPGIFLGGGVQRLLHRDGIKPGQRAVVIALNNYGYIIAQQMLDAGVSVEAIADCRGEKETLGSDESQHISKSGIPIYFESRIKSALGRRHVKGAVLSKAGRLNKTSHKIACDTICVSGNRSPANDLIFQRTCSGSYVLESPYQIARKPYFKTDMEIEEGFYVSGEASGIQGSRCAYLQGKIAGLSAALSLDYGDQETKNERTHAKRTLEKMINEVI